MAIQQDQFQATPYTSTVPLVQVPPQAIEQQSRPAAPLQGQFGGHKGTGGLLIGDALLKGFMAGHQQKEQKQQAKAQATINAADAASEGAYRAYQDALTKAGGKKDDPAAQAAYQSYVATFQAGKQAKAQYVIPDKTQKGKKAAGDTDPVKSPDDKKKKGAVSAGFNNIKDFFEANPHIVPQIALLTMQPKPEGLSTEGQVQSLELQTAQRTNQQAQQKQNDQNLIAMYGKLSPEEIAKLPPDVQKQINDPQNGLKVAQARYAMEQPAKGKYDLFVDEQNNYHSLPEGTTDIPAGWKPYAKPTGAALRGEEAFVAEYAGKNGIDPAGMDPSTRKYLHDVWAYRNPQTTSSVSGATVDAQGNRTATNKSTRSSAEPRPPQGVAPVSGMVIQPPPGSAAAPTAQGIPSTAPKGASKTGTGKPLVNPKQLKSNRLVNPSQFTKGGKQTALTASVTRQAVQKQQEGYQKAEKAYSKALEDADKAFAAAQKTATTTGDPSILATAQAAKNRAVARARLDLEDAKSSVAKEYDAAVKSIGGTPGGQGGDTPVSFTLPNGDTVSGTQAQIDAYKKSIGLK